ncbi:hypothetical protein [Streptomyces sp. NPDC002133]|uniref:hypothetical protein n=1 Tax=Streptomyces sp. NPDC002133 TaxID=3154409 RepID=UPI003331A043
MITIATPSGTVRAARPRRTPPAQRYTPTGTATEAIHMLATHGPSRSGEVDAIRASPGSVNDMRRELPAAPLVRIRSRAHTGSMVHLPAHPAGIPWKRLTLDVLRRLVGRAQVLNGE